MKADEYVDEGYAMLSTPDIKGRDIDFAGANRITKARYDESPEIKLRAGDTLLAKDGSTLGTVNLVRDLKRPSTVNSSLAVISPGGRLVDAFLLYYFQAAFIVARIEEQKGGMGVPHLFQDDLVRFPLPLPPLREQKRIAAFLDRETAKIDALVGEQQRLIELLKEKRQAIISRAVSKGLDPSAPMKNSGVEWLGKVPAHWEVVKFGRAIDYQEGPGIMADDFRDEGVPLMRVAGVGGRWATLQGCNFLDPEKVAKRWDHFRLTPGELVISASASMGTVSEVGPDAEGAIPYTGLIRLRPKDQLTERGYIRALVSSRLFFVQIDLLKTGATIQHFGPVHLARMFVTCPPLAEQRAIAAYVEEREEQFAALIGAAESGIELLIERRAALISAAVTGKLDVGSQSAASAELELA
ncbi:MAG: restriction endonuclease subunit S [Pseudomonadota bacterium]